MRSTTAGMRSGGRGVHRLCGSRRFRTGRGVPSLTCSSVFAAAVLATEYVVIPFPPPSGGSPSGDSRWRRGRLSMWRTTSTIARSCGGSSCRQQQPASRQAVRSRVWRARRRTRGQGTCTIEERRGGNNPCTAGSSTGVDDGGERMPTPVVLPPDGTVMGGGHWQGSTAGLPCSLRRGGLPGRRPAQAIFRLGHRHKYRRFASVRRRSLLGKCLSSDG